MMRRLLSGIALAALTLTPALADPGGGKGHGGGGGGGPQQERGNDGGNGGGQDRGPMMQMAGPGNGHGNGHGSGHADRDNGPPMQVRESRGNQREVEHAVGHPQDRAMPVQAQARGRSDENIRGNDGGDFKRTTVEVRRPDWRALDQRGLINGCPPGLAKKNNGCMPPGLAKREPVYNYPANWWGLRGINDLSGYRYYNGDLVRLSPSGGIANYYPLLGGSLAVGNPWPSAWSPTPLDPYYANYYGLGDDYRYFDGAIYNVDPTTNAIQAVAALLTGDTFNVGQRMPSGYDVYNVPYQYRSRYVDSPDSYYRYSDGYVYQVDPKTQLIMAAIQLLT